MNVEPAPVVNGCYIDERSNMFKVRMVSYSGPEVSRIVFEDTRGNMNALNFSKWQGLHLIPCCQSSNDLQQNPSFSP